MTKDDLDEIAKRETHCKPWGEAVTISRAEKDQLVALARDGMRYRFWRHYAWYFRSQQCLQSSWPRFGEIAVPHGMLKSDAIDAIIDAEMAKEGA